MVSNIEHRFTKGGKPFGTLSLEDYHDNITFFLFGDDYPKYKAYMTEGWFLYAQCRVQERKWGNGELEMKLASIELLSEIKEKAQRSVSVSVSLEDLNMEIIESIVSLSEQFPGKHNLKFVVTDFDEGYKVPLRSKKFKINLDEAFILQLKQIPFLEIKIN
jgi:DNA polymerase-3 subunit alpha